MSPTRIFSLVMQEGQRVDKKQGRPFASEHEFYGVLKEEVEEAWQIIKQKETDRNYRELENELIQIMTVCYRYLKQKA